MNKGTRYGRPKGETGIEAFAVQILQDSKKPMTAAEITQRILKKRSLKSKKPVNSVYAVLYRSDRFKMVGPSLFSLTDEK